MEYRIKASSKAPALAIFLVDVSASMHKPMGDQLRIDVVREALKATFQRMVALATKGRHIAPRYQIALYAYSDEVYDLLDGIKPISYVAQLGAPDLETQLNTDTARGFAKVEELLRRVLPDYAHCPAPVVCHLTDGKYTEADPEPIAKRIMQMRVADGPILITNIFISDDVLPKPVDNPRLWPGIDPATTLADDYARKLRAMSSPLPESYRAVMREWGYAIKPGATMLFPGQSQELVSLGFALSTASTFSDVSPAGQSAHSREET